MEAVCQAALTRGMSRITITDHVDFEPLDPCHAYFRPDEHWQAVQRCRADLDGHLTLCAGIECGEPHLYRRQIEPLLAAHDYDFILGSLHWAGERPTFDAAFFNGLALDEGLALYFDHLARLAEEGEFDVLAHPDIIRRATFFRFGLQELDYRPHEARVRRVLHALAERGKGLEVNTSYQRRGMGAPGPAVQVLRWFREEGGQIVTFGSDAHRPEDVGADFDHGLALVRQAGFERLATFRQRNVEWLRLE
jgi:histidinol-phosphatase (PHP family)